MNKIRRPIRRVDSNHKEIVQKLRMRPDISVWDTHILGEGFPDIIVGHGGNNYLFEIKKTDGKTFDLTIWEIKFANYWRGGMKVVFSYEDICRAIGVNP